MQTISKYGAAADTEAQVAGPEKTPLGRAKVAVICLTAALSGAAVASVARVRTRTYVADLYAGLGGTFTGPDQLNKKLCGPSGKVCEGTTRCYEKLKDEGETKYKCAESESLSSSWQIAAAWPGASHTSSGTSKKKPSADPLSGGGPCHGFKGKTMCAQGMDPQCDEKGNYLGSSKCNFCITSKGQAHRGKIDKCPQEVIDNL